MASFAKGIKTLFTGADTSEQDALVSKARENERLSRDSQFSALTGEQQRVEQQSGKAERVPRGRRLLLAATGEAGLPGTLG